MNDITNREINYEKIEEIKKYLLKSTNHFGGAKFSAVMKGFTNEEKIILFSDSDILKRVRNIRIYDVLASIFRSVPLEIQELIWENVESQKVLLGFGTASDEQILEKIKNKKFFNQQELTKKDKRGEFYYNSTKLRALEVLVRYIKSPKIIENLNTNRYFHLILLGSKKVPDSLYNIVNVDRVFSEIINSDYYKIAPSNTKELWCTHINQLSSNLLLPPDFKQLYRPMSRYDTSFWGDNASLGSMLSKKLIALYSRKMNLNIDSDVLKLLGLYEINVLKSCTTEVVNQDVINEELKKMVLKGIDDRSIFCEQYLDTRHLDVKIQCTIFKLIIENTIGNSMYEEPMLKLLYAKLFQNEYAEEINKILMISLKNAIVNTDEETITNLFYHPNDVKSVFFLRFNLTARNMDYINSFTVDQLMKVNVKHVNRLVKLLYDPESDELSDVYSIAIKMYFVFGLAKAEELASNKELINKKFRDNVSKLNVKNVEMKSEGKKYLPVHHEEFNRFLFVANNIKALADKETYLNSAWYYLYNHFDEIKETCHGHINLVQAEIILKEQVGTVKYDLPPDCIGLEPILYEAGLGNKGHSYTNEQIYEKMCDMYRKQLRNVKSSIPYVDGTLPNGWRYQTMRFDDEVAYVLGYRASCCIRTGDIAHNHLLHALHSEYGKILLVYKPNGEIASFSPLKRNGELLIANSIETIDKEETFTSRIIETFQAGIDAICEVSKKEEESSCIKVATIGTESSRKPIGEAWPYDVPTPTILEKDDPIYGNTDSYHRRLTIIHKDKNNLKNLKYGEVDHRYYNPRKKIRSCVHEYSEVGRLKEYKLFKIVNSIHYMKCMDDKVEYSPISSGYYSALFLNDDWFIIVTYDGKMISEYLNYDERALKEMNATLETIKDYQDKKENIKDLVYTYNKKVNV